MKILPVGWRGNYEITFLHHTNTRWVIFSYAYAILDHGYILLDLRGLRLRETQMQKESVEITTNS